jgi:hypothetical protein
MLFCGGYRTGRCSGHHIAEEGVGSVWQTTWRRDADKIVPQLFAGLQKKGSHVPLAKSTSSGNIKDRQVHQTGSKSAEPSI